MRKYALEFSDEVLMKYVHLYVNQWTEELGDASVAALGELSKRGKGSGLIDVTARELSVFGIQ